MVASVRPIRVDLRLATHRTSADFASLYEVSARHKPPVINLESTLGRRLLGPARNEQLNEWMRANYTRLSSVMRVCLMAIFAMWAAPRSVGRIVTPIAAIGCLPIVIMSPLIMSADVLHLLFQQHEFWDIAATSANNWVVASILFDDARVTGCLMCFAINLVAVMMDANFRTIVVAARTALAWFPAILCIILVCVMRIADIEPARFKVVIPENKIQFTLANWFLNINATLVILMAKLSFRRRRVLTKAFLTDRVIPCSTIGWDLVLRRMGSANQKHADCAMGITAAIRVDGTACIPSSVSRRHQASQSAEEKLSKDVEAETNLAMQTVRVITPTLAFLDLRNALIPAWMPSCRLSLASVVVLYTTGAVGLFLAALTMYLPAQAARRETAFDDILGLLALPPAVQTVVPAGSLFCTSLFFSAFIGSYQRDILRALRQNFDVIFMGLQFHLGCLCLADMMHWDTRCLALIAWDLWFHWILLWDALVPELRDRFRFQKIYGTPVLVTILLGLVWIVYSLFFSSYDALDDRTLVRVAWGSLELTIRTSTFLVGRVTTVLTWSLHLVWKAVRADEDDLVFIRGRVEYFTPLEFFPPVVIAAVASSADTDTAPNATRQRPCRWLDRLRARRAGIAARPLPALLGYCS